MLTDLDKCSTSAERKLQAALLIPLAGICSFARVLSGGTVKFKYCLEPVVCSVYSPGQHSSCTFQYSDIEIVQVMSLPSSQEGNFFKKMVALVELKFGHFTQVKSDHFAQLFHMHAAALALKSGLWNGRLLCCIASLTDWHLFLLEVCTR